MSGQNKPGQQIGFAGFGNLAASSAAPGSGFTFGSATSTLGSSGTSGFSFGSALSAPQQSGAASSVAQSQGPTSFTSNPSLFGTAVAPSAPSTGLSVGFGQGTAGLSLGAATSKPSIFGTAVAPSAPSTGSSVGFGQGTAGLSLGAATSKPSIFGTAVAPSAPSTGSSVGFGQGTAGLSLGAATSKPSIFGTAVAPSAPSTGSSVGFGQGTAGLSLGAATSKPSIFGTAVAPSAPSTGSSVGFGQGTAGLSLGAATSKPSIFGAVASTSTASTAASIGFGQGTAGLSLGATSATGAIKQAGPGFSYGLQSSHQSGTESASSAIQSLGSAAKTTPALPVFGTLGATTTTKSTASSGLTLGSLQTPASIQSSTSSIGFASAAAQNTTMGPSFRPTTTPGQTATQQPISLLGASSQPTTTSSTPFGILGAKSTVQPLGLSTANATQSTTKATSLLQSSASTTTSAASTTTEKPLTYKQLEDIINKWVNELDEQENAFLNQAKQVNIWDRLLIENGEKITQLNDEIERLKTDQSRLDRELDFILSQQQELEEVLAPLEDQIKAQQSIPYMQHTDLEREKTYKMAENIDAQLKRMMQDIKDIISHINSSNVNLNESDHPMTQIAKILNSHMDSLQWVDQNAALLQRKVEDINRQVENKRRDHERSLRWTFD